jgi:hypothetical protein
VGPKGNEFYEIGAVGSRKLGLERKRFHERATTDEYEVRFLTSYNGLVVQLVRIPACHAGGCEFESRLDRQIQIKYDKSRII